MPNYLHRTTKQYLKSVSPASLPEPEENYIYMPNMTAVIGVPLRYWVITGDTVSEMTPLEKSLVDAANLSILRDRVIQGEVDNIESVLRQVVQMMISKINILRQQINTTTAEAGQLTNTNLTDRTMAQVKSQLRNNLGT